MDSMKIPMNERYIIFQSLLKGSAKVEHALHLDQLRRDDALSTNDVKLFVDRLVKKFDAGQHEALLKQLNWVKQTRSDVDYFAFEARFLQIVDGLRAYEYRYSDEQLVMMVKSKMIGWDRVAPFDPKTLDEIGEAVRKLGAPSGSPGQFTRPAVLPIARGRGFRGGRGRGSRGGRTSNGRSNSKTAPRPTSVTTATAPPTISAGVRCFRCDSTTHRVKDCKARPPAQVNVVVDPEHWVFRNDGPAPGDFEGMPGLVDSSDDSDDDGALFGALMSVPSA